MAAPIGLTAGRRASDLAYAELRARILDLRLPPGAMVNELAMVSELGLGRMPVREAIARLAVDKFVTVRPRRGTVVTAVSVADVVNMFEAREAIECGVVHVVAGRITRDELSTLRSLVRAADRVRTGTGSGTGAEAILRGDHAIHAMLVHLVRNSLLQDAADRLLAHNLRFWRLYWSSRPAQHATMLPHDALLAALTARDPEQAEQAMRAHLEASRQLLHASF